MRFSRDKRGYENFYLVETITNRRDKTRARVLYWFRTPPGVKVGREPFDTEVRRALEQQYPGVAFDWRKISETPVPSADAERWRERRRLEKAERVRRREVASARERGAPESAGDEASPDELTALEEAGELDLTPFDPHGPESNEADEPLESAASERGAGMLARPSSPASGDAPPSEGSPAVPWSPDPRRRRRRRRRGGQRPQQMAAAGQSGSNEPSAGEATRESHEPADPDKV